MPPEERTLTIHCSGPDPIVPVPVGDQRPGSDGAQLWFTTLDAHRERVAAYARLLDPVELQRADRFRFPHDRERFVIAHALLRTLLGRYLGSEPAEIGIARGPYGKPYVEGTDLSFNLSDTKDALLIAFTRGYEIGVDIETMLRKVDHARVSEHYFTPDEITGMASSTDSKRRFLELWTRKEAVLKASGVGIMDDLRVLRVDGEVNHMTIRHEAFMQYASEAYHVHTWMLGADHIISLAGNGPLDGVRLMNLDA